MKPKVAQLCGHDGVQVSVTDSTEEQVLLDIIGQQEWKLLASM